MDKKKKYLIYALSGSLLLVLILLISGVFKKNRRILGGSQSTAQAEEARVLGHYYELDQRFKGIGWERDPFGMIVVNTRTLGGSSYLKGIIWDDVAPIAIFGSALLKAGEKFDGYTVLDIRKESVILSDGEFIYELKLEESIEDIKRWRSDQ